MKRLIIFLIAICSASSFLQGGQEITHDEALNYIESVRALFQSRYAPVEWKKDFCGWDLDREIDKVKQEIQSQTNFSTKDFQRVLTKFFNSTKDYHVGCYFYSSERASLPFKVKRFGDRYYITYVDTTRIGGLQIGDELVGFDGQEPDDVVQQLKKTVTPSASEETDQSLAEIYLTKRGAMVGMAVPRGPILIKVKDKESHELNTMQLIWTYVPERVSDIAVALKQKKNVPKWLDSERMKLERTLPLPQNYLSFSCSDDEDEPMTLDPNEIGAKKSFLPPLGQVIWETKKGSKLHAYLFINDRERVIGYVRIPGYMLDLEEIAEFQNIIEIMNENAEALVIDQLNNPGGNLFALYALASMLTDKPLVTPREHILLSQEEVMEAADMLDYLNLIHSNEDAMALLGESFYGIPVNYQMIEFMKEYFRFIIDQWKEGKLYTDKTYLYGIDYVNPHPTVRFTKPIVLLINGLDFSCGDFFPAIMQDNGIATLLGTRTAGAGGYVLPHFISNRMGVALITMTGSLGIRPNGDPIENLGVSPDIVNELSPSDIQNGYRGYAQKINDVVNEKLGSVIN